MNGIFMVWEKVYGCMPTFEEQIGVDRMVLTLDTQGKEPDMEALISLYGMDSQDSIDDKQAINNKKTSDTDNKQAISDKKTSDTNDKQAIKSSDKISSLKGISSKTRDNLKKIMEYMRTNPSVGNSEISELLGLSSDRTRLLLITLVNEGLLSMSGNNKERVYSLL